MGWVLMSERELRRIEVLSRVVKGRLTVVHAAEVLGVPSREVVSHLTPFWGTSYGPSSSRQRPHDSGDPSSATAE